MKKLLFASLIAVASAAATVAPADAHGFLGLGFGPFGGYPFYGGPFYGGPVYEGAWSAIRTTGTTGTTGITGITTSLTGTITIIGTTTDTTGTRRRTWPAARLADLPPCGGDRPFLRLANPRQDAI